MNNALSNTYSVRRPGNPLKAPSSIRDITLLCRELLMIYIWLLRVLYNDARKSVKLLT